MNGFFVSFEGPDGSGKSTVLHRVLTQLASEIRPPYLVTREPGGSEIAEAIRQVILEPNYVAMTARTEALLYAAARSQHLTEVVRPALQAGKLVISDRYLDSSLAYQGAGRGLGIEAVEAINQFATAGLLPDLTILLDLKPQVGLARIQKLRPQAEDRMEQEQLAFHQRVYQGYHQLAQRDSQRIKVVDASQPIEVVTQAVIQILRRNLPTLFKDQDD